MIQITVLKQYKSIKASELFAIPDFTVLTGKNGSGKSHLMELMAHKDSSYRSVAIDGNIVSMVKYIGFNGLNPNISDVGGYEDITRKRKDVWNTLNNIINEYHREFELHRFSSVDDFIRRRPSARDSILPYWYEKAGRDIDKPVGGINLAHT